MPCKTGPELSRPKYADHQQDGDYGQILKQQDGKTGSAGLGAQALFIGIELNDDGRG